MESSFHSRVETLMALLLEVFCQVVITVCFISCDVIPEIMTCFMIFMFFYGYHVINHSFAQPQFTVSLPIYERQHYIYYF